MGTQLYGRGMIRVYGDSFVAPWMIDQPLNWPAMVANKLGLPIENKAVRGSSSEYAIKTFFNDTMSGNVNKNDVIIISLPDMGRIHFEFQNEYPRTASTYNSALIEDRKLDKHPWLQQNKEHLKWYFVNVDQELLEYNRSCYIYALKNFADANPSNTILLVSGWHLNTVLPLANVPSNFLKLDVPLMELSMSEIDGLDYHIWTKFTIIDPRANHFSNVNLFRLRDAMCETLLSKSIQINVDSFSKHMYNTVMTKDQYLAEVEKNNLYYFDKIIKNFDETKHK